MDCLNYVVYIIEAQAMKLIKVGCTGNIAQRISELQTGSPDQLEVLWTSRPMSRLEAYRMETHLHKKFDAFLVRGEWFLPDPSLLMFIEDLRIAAPLDWTAPINGHHFEPIRYTKQLRRIECAEQQHQANLRKSETKFHPAPPVEREFNPVRKHNNILPRRRK